MWFAALTLPQNYNLKTAAELGVSWLFGGSERAGQRAAAIQSLLGTAKLNGLNPEAWLKDTLEKLPTCPNSRIDELLPFPVTSLDVKAQNEI